MNRRSWLKSALATIVLAISDGIPKILADDSKVTQKNLFRGTVYCPYIPFHIFPILVK